MRINNNISALKANNQLAKTNKALDKSLGKLSSGYRINSAADDAAGLAISEKMRTQIAGLDQASRNAADGISVIQTAEGALIEVESMLQRMRELSVQSANGIYTTEDRLAIQAEIDQLSLEIERISDNTEFNTMKLLNGNIDRKSYSSDNKVQLISLSDTVNVGDYQIEVTQDARQAVLMGNTTTFLDDAGDPLLKGNKVTQKGSININGESVDIEIDDTIDIVFAKIRNACDNVNVNVFAIKDGTPIEVDKYLDQAGYVGKQFEEGDRLIFISEEFGSRQEIEIYCDSPYLCDILGLTINGAKAIGVDAKASVILNDDSKFTSTATVSIDGNKVTVSDRNDFSMMFEITPGTIQTEFVDAYIKGKDEDVEPAEDPTGGDVKEITVSVLDAGPMDLQIGANEGQIMSVRIPKVTPKTLGIDKINMATADGAQEAIGLLDNAINEISAIRSKLGAYQNRLEHSISNLDVTSENLTESLSRISDVDMADEMATYTQRNVLAQAGTSMLAQANQRPQTILSLLQQ